LKEQYYREAKLVYGETEKYKEEDLSDFIYKAILEYCNK